MIGLSQEQVVLLHQYLIKETGGMNGIRDEGLLESALKWVQFLPTNYSSANI